MDGATPHLDFSPGERDRAVLEKVLRHFWAAAPHAAGVLLVDDGGRPLAYDLLTTADPRALGRDAVRNREEARKTTSAYGPTSAAGTFVPSLEGNVLVVFLPSGFDDAWPRQELPDGIAA